MDGATTGGPNRPLIDDPTFLSDIEDLDRGLWINNGADDTELPEDCSPVSPPLPSQSPCSPLPGRPTRGRADDPNFRASLKPLDWSLVDDGVSYAPGRSGSPTIGPQLLGRQRAPAASRRRSRSGPRSKSARRRARHPRGRRLLDPSPVEPTGATRATTPPPAQRPAGPLRPDVSEPPIPPFSDASIDDLDSFNPTDSHDFSPTELDVNLSDSRVRQLTGFGLVAFTLLMTLLGASMGAFVFHARVSRIIVQWQSILTSPPLPTAASRSGDAERPADASQLLHHDRPDAVDREFRRSRTQTKGPPRD